MRTYLATLLAGLFVWSCTNPADLARETIDFNPSWKFTLGDSPAAKDAAFDDSSWRMLDLPHDWSIEGEFSESNPAGVGGGALPGGIGWYRKSFTLSQADAGKRIHIQFDGAYRNSEVWINGHWLGKRPNGYINFQYDLTPHVMLDKPNVLAVRVDNADQPNSRWYSGSGIYRDVKLVKTGPVHVDYNGTYIRTPAVSSDKATAQLTIVVRNTNASREAVTVKTTIVNAGGSKVAEASKELPVDADTTLTFDQEFEIPDPTFWSVENPYLYEAITEVSTNGKLTDRYTTSFGVRTFNFDVAKGFSLNGEPMKLRGVCLHHDFGCLGAAFYERAAERQLQIMKDMGVNAIRTSHNPPASGLLDLCDRMGFIVMDEAFDMWKKQKVEYDYHLYWDEWHRRDLEDQVRRDRNHPSVMIWCIGNEVNEQWDVSDSLGTMIARELAGIVRSLDDTRPITAACNNQNPSSPVIRSGALDLIGYNYAHQIYKDFPATYPGQKFIATETNSSLATRGYYEMPSDSVRVWPIAWDKPFHEGNADHTVSAYDNARTPWGSTQEDTWKIVKKLDFVSGIFIWTGFDYLGEPTPYGWPSRSSYFGIVDLDGFPKDTYYMYQSEWTDKPVLHVYPHWNWPEGKLVDVWAYYNHADEVELFLNDVSLGKKSKQGDDLHVMWRVPFKEGTLKAVSTKDGKEILTREVRTAGKAARIILEADRNAFGAGADLSFVTVKVIDDNGIVVPDASNLVKFEIAGDAAKIIGVDNGDPVSHESFIANERKAFHGLALAVLKSQGKKGTVQLTATAPDLEQATITIQIK